MTRDESGSINSYWKSQTLSVGDRKSTRLNSSHLVISYAVFCLKKKVRPHPRDSERDAEDSRADVVRREDAETLGEPRDGRIVRHLERAARRLQDVRNLGRDHGQAGLRHHD